MQTFNSIDIICRRVTYKDWVFRVYTRGLYFSIQVAFHAADVNTGLPCLQLGREWLIKPDDTDTHIVRTCFLAIKQAEEHELCERFKYLGVAIYNPHIDAAELAQAISNIELE